MMHLSIDNVKRTPWNTVNNNYWIALIKRAIDEKAIIIS